MARVTSDETLYYGTDHQGTTVLMTDEAGVKVWTSEATPFGDAIVTKTGDRDDLALKYTGKDLDEDTGLYYFNARWYDAGTGRFISEDPARDGSNWYIYVSNNPLIYIDPTGMWSFCILSRKDHYARNSLNKTPVTLKDAIDKEFGQLGADNPNLDPEALDDLHEFGPGNEGNDKYTKRDPKNPDASFEAIYDKNGNLVTDPVNMGTYNFVDSQVSILGHILMDVIPYYVYGNSESHARESNFFSRLGDSIKAFFKKHFGKDPTPPTPGSGDGSSGGSGSSGSPGDGEPDTSSSDYY